MGIVGIRGFLRHSIMGLVARGLYQPDDSKRPSHAYTLYQGAVGNCQEGTPQPASSTNYAIHKPSTSNRVLARES